jgi:hypothetical protein
MAFAILKLSYNHSGDSSVTGGICGTGFFIDSFTAVTAHHVLNENTFAPNVGYRHALLWLISRTGAICRIQLGSLSLHPEIDTSILRLPDPALSFSTYPLTLSPIVGGAVIRSIGYIGNAMPSVDAQWQGSELVIQRVDLSSLIVDRDGYVKRLMTLDIDANDVQVHGVRGFELSFDSRVGMSGGPVIDEETNAVVGMLSIGLPTNVSVKTQTFAVSIDQIIEVINPAT